MGASEAPEAPGLVTSAISAQNPHRGDSRPALAFPSADLLGAAAALFDRGPDRTVEGYHESFGGQEWRPYRSDAEGPAPFLRIGPGMVQFGRVDPARAERARVRRDDPRALMLDRDDDEGGAGAGVGDLVGLADGGGELVPLVAVARGEVGSWSRKSQARLIRKVASLDLAPLVTGLLPPAMATLTLPGDWQTVCPSAAAGAAAFHRWTRAYSRAFGEPLRAIWKREFQRRGAPHWHLWLVPPVPGPEFRGWLSRSWTRAVFGSGGDPEERRRHLAAGTGLDFAEGARARDPRRLAVYFLKESLGGEGKAYQNSPPAEWAGQSVGRYWGVRGIEEVTFTVQLDPLVAHKLWRALRKAAEARRAPVVVRVPRGANRAGVVRYRKVTRRRTVRGSAGWVAVNDGASVGEQLSRYWDLLRVEADGMRSEAERAGRPVVVPAPVAG